jgi:hypothetical protein
MAVACARHQQFLAALHPGVFAVKWLFFFLSPVAGSRRFGRHTIPE